jgi:hypothetical protein
MDGKAILAIMGMVIVGVAMAATVNQYNQMATVESLETITFMNSEALTPNATIDWGIVYAGSAYEFNYTVYNNATEAHTVYLLILELPTGWSQQWIANGTLLQPQTGISAPLTLVIPSNTTSKQYSWQHQIVTG